MTTTGAQEGDGETHGSYALLLTNKVLVICPSPSVSGRNAVIKQATQRDGEV